MRVLKETREREILRKQMELLAKDSQDANGEMPALTYAMCEVDKSIKRVGFSMFAAYGFFALVDFVICFVVLFKYCFRSKR